MLNFTLSRPLADSVIAAAIGRELERQVNQIELIASENIVSADVLSAQGSIVTKNFAFGFRGGGYLGVCVFVEVV
jgi:glycine hydroxymethyltransferase